MTIPQREPDRSTGSRALRRLEGAACAISYLIVTELYEFIKLEVIGTADTWHGVVTLHFAATLDCSVI